MAHVYKNNLETVADAILDLRWAEMADLGQHLAGVEVPDNADHAFWSSILHYWATDIMTGYERRCKEESS